MKDSQQTRFATLYQAGLRKHLRDGSDGNPDAALRLGWRAVKLGLETPELSAIHHVALDSQVSAGHPATYPPDMIRRAGEFFAKFIHPIEETHRSAVHANDSLQESYHTLKERTHELAATNRTLEKEIIRRHAVEESLRASEATTSGLLKQALKLQDELRQLSHRLLTAQEEERKRISRELHDVIGETLTGVNVRLATLKLQSTANTNDLHKKIAYTQKLVAKSMNVVHRFACDLRPTVLDHMGLIPSLVAHLKVFSKRTSIPVEFTAFAGVEKLDSAIRTALYRIAQEALSNIARHAHATHTTVSLLQKDVSVTMEISDNGIGFDVGSIVLTREGSCLGILGMRERAEMIGATLRIDSAPGERTILRVDLPDKLRQARKRSSKFQAKPPSTRS
jgi:signal transduction histidine kinase